MIEWWGDAIWEYYAATEGGGTCRPRRGMDARTRARSARRGRTAKSIVVDEEGEPAAAATSRERSTCAWAATSSSTTRTPTRRARVASRNRASGRSATSATSTPTGYLFLNDRSNDMIIVGGVNIYPAEIEGALHPAPGGAPTSRCSVCPTRTPARRSRPSSSCAPASRARATRRPRSIMDYCRDNIARQKHPAHDRLHHRDAARSQRQALQAQAPRPLVGRPLRQARLAKSEERGRCSRCADIEILPPRTSHGSGRSLGRISISAHREHRPRDQRCARAQSSASCARNAGSAIAIRASARSATVLPASSAAPCSVITTSTSWRGVVTACARRQLGDDPRELHRHPRARSTAGRRASVRRARTPRPSRSPRARRSRVLTPRDACRPPPGPSRSTASAPLIDSIAAIARRSAAGVVHLFDRQEAHVRDCRAASA